MKKIEVKLSDTAQQNIADIAEIFGPGATQRVIEDYQARCINTAYRVMAEKNLRVGSDQDFIELITRCAEPYTDQLTDDTLTIAHRYQHRVQDAFKIVTLLNATSATAVTMSVLREIGAIPKGELHGSKR